MAKSTRYDRPSQETVDEAQRLARANQRPGQTKEQTRLIAQGIQKGIEQYKRQQKAKAREMDRRRKRDTAIKADSEPTAFAAESGGSRTQAKLPWILLALSWLGFGLYMLLR